MSGPIPGPTSGRRLARIGAAIPWRHWRRGTPRNAKPNCANDPKGYGHRIPPPSAPAPAAAEQRHAPVSPTMKLFSCARTTRTTPTRSPQPSNSCPRRATPTTRPSDRNAPKLPPSLQSENPRIGRRASSTVSPRMSGPASISRQFQNQDTVQGRTQKHAAKPNGSELAVVAVVGLGFIVAGHEAPTPVDLIADQSCESRSSVSARHHAGINETNLSHVAVVR
jgi:hypothetical protein